MELLSFPRPSTTRPSISGRSSLYQTEDKPRLSVADFIKGFSPRQTLAGFVEGLIPFVTRPLGEKIAPEPTTIGEVGSRVVGEFIGALPTVVIADILTGPAPDVTAVRAAVSASRFAKLASKIPKAVEFLPAVAREARFSATFGALRALGEGKPLDVPRQAAQSALFFTPFGLAGGATSRIGKALLATGGMLAAEQVGRTIRGEKTDPGDILTTTLFTAPLFLIGGVTKSKSIPEFESMLAKALKKDINPETFKSALGPAEKRFLEGLKVTPDTFLEMTKDVGAGRVRVEFGAKLAAELETRAKLSTETDIIDKAAKEVGGKTSGLQERSDAFSPGEYQKLLRGLRFAGEKKSTKSGLRFREHVGEGELGLRSSTDEMSAALGMSENEFMTAAIKEAGRIGGDTARRAGGLASGKIRPGFTVANIDSMLNASYKKGAKEGISETQAKLLRKIEDIKEASKRKLDLRQLKIAVEMRNKYGILIESLKSKSMVLSDMREFAANFVKESVPKSVQGKFVVAIARAKTPVDLTRIASKAMGVAEREMQRQLGRKIVSAAKKLVKSSLVSPSYKRRISELLQSISIKKPTKATTERLGKTLAFFEAELAKGELPAGTRSIISELSQLSKKPVTEMSVQELAEVLESVTLLGNLGKHNAVMNRLEIARKSSKAITEMVEEGTNPLSFRSESNIPGADEGSGAIQEIRDRLRGAMIAARKTNILIKPMEVVLNTLGGNTPGYKDALNRNFKAPVDAAWGKWFMERKPTVDSFVKIKRSLKLGDNNFMRIHLFAIKEQAGGKEALLSREVVFRRKAINITEEALDNLKLSTQEKQMYNFMRSKYDDMYPAVRESLERVYNMDIKKVENYFPWTTDLEALTEAKSVAEIFSNPANFDLLKRRVQTGFAKERGFEVGRPLRLDGEYAFLHYIDSAMYMKHLAEPIEVIRGAVNDPRFSKLVGDFGDEMVKEWLNVLARNGGVSQARLIPTIDTLVNNVGVATLGFRASSALTQVTALFDGGAEIGSEYLLRGIHDVALTPGVREALRSFPELVGRIGDDTAYSISSKAFAPLVWMDQQTASAVTWGAYLRAVERMGGKANPNSLIPEAVTEAQLIMRRTQGSAFAKDLPLAISAGRLGSSFSNKSLAKMFFQFQTFLLNRWSYISHDAVKMGIVEKNPLEAARKMTWILTATIAAAGIGTGVNNVIGRITGKEVPEEEAQKRFARRVLTEMAQTIPFVGQIVGTIQYGSMPVPTINAIARLSEGLGGLGQAKTSAGRVRPAIQVGEAAASVAGIPGTSQFVQFVRNLYTGQSGATAVNSIRERIKDIERDDTIDENTKNYRIGVLRKLLADIKGQQ